MAVFPEEQQGTQRPDSGRTRPPDILARSGLPVPELRSTDQVDVQGFNTDFRRLVARISKLFSILAPTVQGEAEPAGSTTLVAHAPQHQLGGSDELNVTGLQGVLAQDQRPQVHDIEGDRHFVQGLTIGHVYRAAAPNAAAFQAIQDADIPASIARDTEVVAASEESAIFSMALGGEW